MITIFKFDAMTKQTINDYIELTKPRILNMVLVSATLGYFLGGHGKVAFWGLLWLLIGVSAVCAGSATLNHYLERDSDKKMARTRNRPIPAGRIPANNALLFGVALILGGVLFLWLKANLLTAFLSLMSAFLYVLVYTPLKKVSWLHTTIGAIPGALPPLGGWTAATGEISLGGWLLFCILFVWQHPHFYSIAWMFREDYRAGGFKVLPVVQPDGKSTFRQILLYSLLLIPISVMPTVAGMSGNLYFGGACVLGMAMLAQSIVLTRTRTYQDARNLLKASVIYLPALLLLIVVDRSF